MTDKPHPKSDDDHRLLVLFYEWQPLAAEFDRLMELPETPANVAQAEDVNFHAIAIGNAICATPAYSLKGLRAKAKIIQWLHGTDALCTIWPQESTLDNRLAWSLVADVHRQEVLA